MRRSEACGRARVDKLSRGSEMMDSRIETANCEHLADRRHAKRRIALPRTTQTRYRASYWQRLKLIRWQPRPPSKRTRLPKSRAIEEAN